MYSSASSRCFACLFSIYLPTWFRSTFRNFHASTLLPPVRCIWRGTASTTDYSILCNTERSYLVLLSTPGYAALRHTSTEYNITVVLHAAPYLANFVVLSAFYNSEMKMLSMVSEEFLMKKEGIAIYLSSSLEIYT